MIEYVALWLWGDSNRRTLLFVLKSTSASHVVKMRLNTGSSRALPGRHQRSNNSGSIVYICVADSRLHVNFSSTTSTRRLSTHFSTGKTNAKRENISHMCMSTFSTTFTQDTIYRTCLDDSLKYHLELFHCPGHTSLFLPGHLKHASLSASEFPFVFTMCISEGSGFRGSRCCPLLNQVLLTQAGIA